MTLKNPVTAENNTASQSQYCQLSGQPIIILPAVWPANHSTACCLASQSQYCLLSGQPITILPAVWPANRNTTYICNLARDIAAKGCPFFLPTHTLSVSHTHAHTLSQSPPHTKTHSSVGNRCCIEVINSKSQPSAQALLCVFGGVFTTELFKVA